MATSTNFGWTEPNDTDLVKNGASAMRTLGNAIDSTLYTIANGRNPVLNSNFSIWQRGTSGTNNSVNAGQGYNADRWQNFSANVMTCSRQATGDTTNLPFIQYCARVQRNSGQTNTGAVYIAQTVETANAIAFAGKTITLSFYARKGANFSATSDLLSVRIDTGTGTDQNVLGGFTGSASPLSTTFTLTTTWQRFSVSGAIASTVTELGSLFFYTPTGTASTNDYFEITGIQLDLGSVALPYRPNGATYQAELAACQRYYSKSAQTNTTPTDGNSYASDCVYQMNATNSTTNLLTSFFPFPATMRIAPTMTYYRSDLSSTAGKWGYYSGSWNAATVTIGTLSDKGFSVNLAGTYTANNAYSIAGGWAASAEL